MIWSLFGAIVGWIQGALGQFRSTSGYLEHTSNGTWYPVSSPLIKASENVKYTWATERFTSAGAIEAMKVAQFTPIYSGIMRLRAEVKYVSSAGSIILINPNAIGNSVSSAALTGNGAYGDGTAITTLPLGTILANGLGYAISSVVSVPSTAYTAVVSDISITAGVPVMIVLYDGSVASGQSYIKNITVSYDLLTASEQMV